MLCETQKISELCLQQAFAQKSERRRFHRKPFLREATIIVPGDRPRFVPVFCRDISLKGIGLFHEEPVEIGREITLSIPLLGRVLQIKCTLAWCRRAGDNQYLSGGTYRCDSTPKTLVLLSAALSQELSRRLSRRYPLVRPVMLEDVQGNTFPAFCRDISRQGIGLIHRQPIAPGCVVISMPSTTDAELTATADLRWCSPIGRGWYSSGGRFPLEEVKD